MLARVTGAGVRALAVDTAGHGPHARRPAALTRRPFDASLLATELSPVAGVDLDEAGELLISQIGQLGAGDPVVVVAHSLGGVVLTRAAQLAPALVARAVYLTACMPASGVPAVAYTRMPEHEGGLALSCVGALAFQIHAAWAVAVLWFIGGAGLALITVVAAKLHCLRLQCAIVTHGLHSIKRE